LLFSIYHAQMIHGQTIELYMAKLVFKQLTCWLSHN